MLAFNKQFTIFLSVLYHIFKLILALHSTSCLNTCDRSFIMIHKRHLQCYYFSVETRPMKRGVCLSPCSTRTCNKIAPLKVSLGLVHRYYQGFFFWYGFVFFFACCWTVFFFICCWTVLSAATSTQTYTVDFSRRETVPRVLFPATLPVAGVFLGGVLVASLGGAFPQVGFLECACFVGVGAISKANFEL